jgi:hypothetical protein
MIWISNSDPKHIPLQVMAIASLQYMFLELIMLIVWAFLPIKYQWMIFLNLDVLRNCAHPPLCVQKKNSN